MMNSVAPVWDGNETWLVLGGGGLMAAFPLAYAVRDAGALCADHRDAARADLPRRRVRVPLARPGAGQFLWDCAFAGGLARLRRWRRASRSARCVQGIPVADRAYAGGWWDWLTPFSILTGVALVIGYALLGATWLI